MLIFSPLLFFWFTFRKKKSLHFFVYLSKKKFDLYFISQFRENKEEEKVKTIKKKQRGILLKVTKNIIELDK